MRQPGGQGKGGQAQQGWNNARPGRSGEEGMKGKGGKGGGGKKDLDKNGKPGSWDGRKHAPGLCSDWIETGTCKYGDGCKFAHCTKETKRCEQAPGEGQGKKGQDEANSGHPNRERSAK